MFLCKNEVELLVMTDINLSSQEEIGFLTSQIQKEGAIFGIPSLIEPYCYIRRSKMPKGISIDEKEKEIQILKSGVGELEKKIEKLDKELAAIRNASEKINDHIKALHESAVALIKKAHEFE